MGIVLKRKAPDHVVAEAVTGAVAAVKKIIKLGGRKPAPPEVTQDESDALALVGLGDYQPKTPYQTAGDKAKSLKGEWPALSEGDKVVITNYLYSWVDRWKPEDTGVVEKFVSPVPEARNEGLKWALVIVRLDRPRKAGHEVCYFHNWELEPITKEQQ